MSDRLHHNTGDSADRSAVLAKLRARIRALEGLDGGPGTGRLPFGLPAIDSALPEGGLPLGCLHEIAGSAPAGDTAATGFAAVLLGWLAARFGPVLWVTGSRDLHAPGLAAFGLPPDRLVVAEARRAVDRLWALEEAARSAALAAVLGEIDSLDLTASRRLQLAAETGGLTVLLLRRRPVSGSGSRGEAGAAVTRWRVAALPSRSSLLDSGRPEPEVGAPCWRLELLRCRGGRPGDWLIAWRGPVLGPALLAATPPAEPTAARPPITRTG